MLLISLPVDLIIPVCGHVGIINVNLVRPFGMIASLVATCLCASVISCINYCHMISKHTFLFHGLNFDVSQDDSGKVRMKPRDPRRALHKKSLQKPGYEGPDLPVTNSSTAEGTKGNPKQADPKVLSSQPLSAPDIAWQFTKNLKNIADIVSVSQTTSSASVQTPSSQPAQVHPSFVNMKGPPAQPGHLQNGIGKTSEEAASTTSQSQNTWGDVEHYFGRFDDQQRAAIQRERSKRMEEQKKMFADHKLCLVLDLDHTLLNSAKVLVFFLFHYSLIILLGV